MTTPPHRSLTHQLRDLLPRDLRQRIRDWRGARWRRRFESGTPREIFSSIYEHGLWGAPQDGMHRYCSGSGSRDPSVVGPYVQAVSTFLDGFYTPPSVVDLGCGDFVVGARLRARCGAYVACDVVESVIEENRRRYADLGVEFRALDMIDEPLPAGDVVFVRQVFQHLANAQIRAVLPKIVATYRYLVLTEHLAQGAAFRANLDKPAGSDTRLEATSGVVLTLPPFDLTPRSERVICEVPEYGGVVRTTVYQLRAESDA